MRPRRRLTWLIFALCALLVVDGLGWVTWEGVRLERRRREAELLRLALWRMDSELTPLLAQEAARPYFQYRSFYPAERAYTRMWEEILPNEVLVPSPLLEAPRGVVRIHFEIDAQGTLTSPQAPTGNMRDQAESTYVTAYRILQATEDLHELSQVLRLADPTLASGSGSPGPIASLDAETWQRERSQSLESDYLARQQVADAARGQNRLESRERQVAADLSKEGAAAGLADRASPVTDRPDEPLDPASAGVEVGEAERRAIDAGSEFLVEGARADGRAAVELGALRPLWRTNSISKSEAGAMELVFVRDVRVGASASVQGFWIDWPMLQAALTGAVADLFPEASLVPLSGAIDPDHRSRVLAAAPILLEPGRPNLPVVGVLSATRLPLLVTWVATLGAVAAIGLVLRASMRLSERRGRFVSAVTHELRTPLTTFCLYSQMLDDGMISEEERKREYLRTLRHEADRLAKIVENVLAYARLGDRKRVVPSTLTSVRESLERLMPTLAERAARGSMELRPVIDLPGNEARWRAEPEVVERILTNLVDNAIKYAGDSATRTIELHARVVGGSVEIDVRDHGPGVPPHESNRIFVPFQRAKRDQDSAKSGLGLGLSLAREAARVLGGDLVLSPCEGAGARFVVRLPVG